MFNYFADRVPQSPNYQLTMIAIVFRIAILALIGYGIYRGATWLISEVFSDSKRCPRCDGKGWWQNTRNRDKQADRKFDGQMF